MAICPHLGLEEPGTAPFPFPSVSHRCYVTGLGRSVGQSEQRTFCLVKHYTKCPFFLTPCEVADLAVTSPEPAAFERPATPPEEAPRARPTMAEPEREALGTSVEDTLSQQRAHVPPPEPVPVARVSPTVAHKDLGSAPTSLKTGALAGKHHAPMEAGLSPVALRPLPRPSPRAPILAAMASVSVALLCFVGLSVYGVLRWTTTDTFLLGSSDLVAGALLALSVASFAVVLILVALLLWARLGAA